MSGEGGRSLAGLFHVMGGKIEQSKSNEVGKMYSDNAQQLT